MGQAGSCDSGLLGWFVFVVDGDQPEVELVKVGKPLKSGSRHT